MIQRYLSWLIPPHAGACQSLSAQTSAVQPYLINRAHKTQFVHSVTVERTIQATSWTTTCRSVMKAWTCYISLDGYIKMMKASAITRHLMNKKY